MKIRILRFVSAVLLTAAFAAQIHAQGTAFQYQGRLNYGGNPVTGIYDLRFAIYDTIAGATVVAGPQSTPGHAMKAAESGRAQGAIPGKAMSAPPEGKGMVLVLVTLQ